MVWAILALAAALASPVLAQAPAGSEAEQLREELRQLRREYEERIRQLELRLQGLESGPPPATTSAPAIASSPAATAGDFAKAAFQRETESRERAAATEAAPWRERAEQVLQDFLEIKGYFRAGYGRNDAGGPQTGFQAPGAFSKYRLGNEAENYGELTFGKNFYVPDLFKLDNKTRADGTPTGPIARVQATVSVFNPYADLLASGSTDFGLPEAWGAIGNVAAGQPGMKFWAGSRYYRRHDIHISDFFFYNLSGTGGGVEDIELPFGRLALAWIGSAATSGFSDLPEPDAENEAGFSKANWDLRLYDVPLPLGEGEFGLVYARADSGRDAAGNTGPDSDGVAVTLLHTRGPFLSEDGVNKFSLQFGTGAAKTFTSGFETLSLTNGVYIRPEARDSWRFRATEHFTAGIGEHFSVGPALVYQVTDYGDDGGLVQWVSAGVRPMAHLNRHLSVALEGGVDWVKDETAGTSGAVWKITLAPQVSLGRLFMSRPVVRGFVTYAEWADDFRGQVGGSDYATAGEGLTYGVQMESWW